MITHITNKLTSALFKNHLNSEMGFFSGNVDFSIWADAAYLILLNKLNLNSDVSLQVQYIMSCQTKEGGWGVISDSKSEVSYKNSLLAYYAIKDHISQKESEHIKSFLDSYTGNRWVDPYTKLLIAEQGEKFMYPPLFSSFTPLSIAKFMGRLHLIFPAFFRWSIFLFPSGWTRNAFPQLSAGAYILNKSKRPKRLVKLIDKVLDSQLKNGSWFDTILPTIGSLYTLHLYGLPNDSYPIKRGLEFLKEKIREDGGLNRFDLTVWNTSLSLIALMSNKEFDPQSVNASIVFLINSQNKDGGWAFSTNNMDLPDHDDTALSLIALKYCEINGYKIPSNTVKKGIAFLLQRQNIDGGWGAFDKNQSRKKPGYLPPWHIEYGHELKDPSTADVSGHALWALSLYREEFDLEPYIRKANRYLEKDQVDFGYWYGRWGLCYIYGTSRAIISLSAISNYNPAIIKGVEWIENIQNEDGGWGETYLSYFNETPILGESDIVLTSWCLIALMKFHKQKTKEINKGIAFLLDYLKEVDIDNIPTSFSASAIEPAIYDIYYYIFPLQALNEYNKLQL